MKIIIDAMGGDHAPKAAVEGGLLARKEYDCEVVLVGRGEEILRVIGELGYQDLPKGIEIAHASQVITMEDDPTGAIREKKDSSLVVGLRMLAAGEGDALVSAGSTGALLTGATLIAKRIRGIRRAALAPVLPTAKGGALLLDSGANAECPPEYLLQFAYMGAYYAGAVMGIKDPGIGLLNIGIETSKGGPLQKETYPLMEAAGNAGEFRFVGNVEARDVLFGASDVVVADGFSGNVLLKSVEGTGMYMAKLVKGLFLKNLKTKLAALLMKDQIREFKKTLDYSEVGGAPLLGISRPVIKAHGSSNAVAVKNAVHQAIKFAESGMIERITQNVEKMRLLDK